MKSRRLRRIVSCLVCAIILMLNFNTTYAKEGNVVKCMNSNYSLMAVTEQNSIPGQYDFTRYFTNDFSQGETGKNCGPTLAANVLSYYKDVKGLNLYSGTINQSFYDKICEAVKFNSSEGTNLNNVAAGIKKIATDAGYTCKIDKYWLNLWSDVTRDIERGYPVMLSFNGHAYMVVGYRVRGNIKELNVFTSWSSEPFMWIEYLSTMQMQSVNIYNK